MTLNLAAMAIDNVYDDYMYCKFTWYHVVDPPFSEVYNHIILCPEWRQVQSCELRFRRSIRDALNACIAWRRTDTQTNSHKLLVLWGRDLIILSLHLLLQCPQGPVLHPSLPIRNPNHARGEARISLLSVKVSGTATTGLLNPKEEAAPRLPFWEYVVPLVYRSEL